MSRSVMIILGNGFTMDFLSYIDNKEIDVSNLFKNGENVPWPENNKSGFLSYKHCPNLWTLGARPFLDNLETITLIEDIITCANILQIDNRDVDNIYFKAYKELAQYLNSLFIYYDKKITLSYKLIKKLKDWGWGKYFKTISNDPNISKVYIVTFNYDIWLERVLKELGIDFNIVCFENKDCKFQVFKPHGSISFQSKIKRDKDAFRIDYSNDRIKDDVSQFNVKYNDIDPFNVINAIIPPAGDSSRLNFEWARCIRDEAKKIAEKLKKDDELIVSGISYWHVDRLEIDSILTQISSDISNVEIINPNPPRVINAVMTTLFKNVIFDTHCKNLI